MRVRLQEGSEWPRALPVLGVCPGSSAQRCWLCRHWVPSPWHLYPFPAPYACCSPVWARQHQFLLEMRVQVGEQEAG